MSLREDIQLEEGSSFVRSVGRHDVNEVRDCSTVQVVAVICLDCLLERYRHE